MTVHTTIGDSSELFWFRGTLVNVRLSWHAGEDRVSVVEHLMPYGKSPPLHIHRNEDQVFHVLEGEILIHIDGVETVARAGETVLAPKGVPHSFRVESREGARCLTITSGGDLEKMIREMGEPALNAELPPQVEPTPAMIAALRDACARNGIDIIGGPLT
ncbi:cupin domain-containing protein [Mesorhizobium marinum]|uniref:Cupin domain-containing protein n=1 Tax=Mesorhizobium marinum TaxID=3228790 RepID=A0ABV3R049_9HYPH